MDSSSYINSGVLELYVLDRLSPDERREVERYAEQYPEVRQELTEIEVALEKYAVLRGAQTPPPVNVLDDVLSAIGARTTPPTTTTVAPPAPAAPAANPLPWLLTALLALALGGLIYYYLQAGERRESIDELEQRFTLLEQECEQQRANFQADRQRIALLTRIDTRDVLLAGSENAPDSRALVFYNPSVGEVLFSASNLPAPPAGKQYQLWALDAEGQPLDLGVLSPSLTNQELLDVRYVPNASAFAVTLEDAGGKPSPDLSQLQVIGEVPS